MQEERRHTCRSPLPDPLSNGKLSHVGVAKVGKAAGAMKAGQAKKEAADGGGLEDVYVDRIWPAPYGISLPAESQGKGRRGGPLEASHVELSSAGAWAVQGSQVKPGS